MARENAMAKRKPSPPGAYAIKFTGDDVLAVAINESDFGTGKARRRLRRAGFHAAIRMPKRPARRKRR